jgi:hypothetical protein
MLLVYVLTALAACGMGGSNIGGTPGGGGFPSPPLNPSEDPEQAEIAGEIDFEGFTLFTDGGEPGPKEGEAVTAGSGVMAKILDPGDDILSEKALPVRGTYRIGFRPSLKTGTIRAKIQFEMRVVEDLDGDGSGGDTLLQVVPVTLQYGRAARLNITVRPASPTDVNEVLAPATGAVLFTSLEQTDAAGEKENVYATLVASDQQIFDRDGDNVLEPGEDSIFSDGDANGWPDSSEDAYGDPASAVAEISGIVTEVDPVAQRIAVSSEGTIYSFDVDPFAVIQQLAADGTLLGQLTLERSLTGREVRVQATDLNGRLTAQRILVLAEVSTK